MRSNCQSFLHTHGKKCFNVSCRRQAAQPVLPRPRFGNIQPVHEHCQFFRPHRDTPPVLRHRPPETALLQALVPQPRVQVLRSQRCVLSVSHIRSIRSAAGRSLAWASDITGTEDASCCGSMMSRSARFHRNGRTWFAWIQKLSWARGARSFASPT